MVGTLQSSVYVPPGCAMDMFVRHYMRLQHDREKDKGYQEKRTKVVRSKIVFCFFGIEEFISALSYSYVDKHLCNLIKNQHENSVFVFIFYRPAQFLMLICP
jgi:hypothetical protein